MVQMIKESRVFYLTSLVGNYAVALGIVVAGVVLVASGDRGDTMFKLFGQSVETGSVGIAAIAVGGLVLVMLIRATMRSFDHTVATEGVETHNPRRDHQ
ncbi:hypothetical protein [Streptomyces sp. NPDC058475]|uniref:hypothetical protein n=1 Tax=unclassified Streptomyces TaxID=2593676 RepID=UPI00365A2CAC